ncbi:MAG: hypothetical protein R3229_01835 [Alphaproteobacteria bacterium]|nr:hypothetical protein [Alphaproteobacteria bacterium]
MASVKESSRELNRGREWRRIVLDAGKLGSVTLRINLPHPLPDAALPVVIVLGGLETGGRGACRLIDAGGTVLIGYEWPVRQRLPRGMALWQSLPGLYEHVLSVPGQIAAALKWVGAQTWADGDRITLVGLSLGALAAPAVQRLAAAEGVTIRWTVLGYGGSPLGSLVSNHPDIEPAALRPLLGRGLGLLLRPVEPSSHLPHLKGKFLVFGGTDDSLIGPDAARQYAALVPEPKVVRWLQSDHLGVGGGARDLLDRVVGETIEWLRARGAVDMSGHSPGRPRLSPEEC